MSKKMDVKLQVSRKHLSPGNKASRKKEKDPERF